MDEAVCLANSIARRLLYLIWPPSEFLDYLD